MATERGGRRKTPAPAGKLLQEAPSRSGIGSTPQTLLVSGRRTQILPDLQEQTSIPNRARLRRTIHVERGRFQGKSKTRITVDQWPGHGSHGFRVSTPDTGDHGRQLVAIGFANWRHDEQLGSAVLHVPGRHEPSLLITDLRVSPETISANQRDATLGLIACALDVAAELKSKLRLGDGCLEWRVSDEKAADALRLTQGFGPIDPNSKRAKRLRGQVQLRRC